MSFEAFLGILNNSAFLLALGVLYNTFSDAFFADSKKYKVVVGIFIGFLGIAVMLNPWNFGHGVIFDTRSILLSVTALFFGPVPAVISTLMMSALRIYQGGAGAVMGVGMIFTSTFFGLLLRYLLNRNSRKVQNVRWYELFLLGVVIHVVMLLWMLTLPEKVSSKVVSALLSSVLTVYPIVTIFLGLLLSKQIKKREVQLLLKNKESQFKKAERVGGLGHWTFDFNTGIVHASEGARKIAGIEKHENAIKYIQQQSLSEYREELDLEMKNLLEKDIPYDIQFKLRRPSDGRIVDIRSVAEYDRENNLVFGVIYDETEKKKMLDKMEQVDKIESLGILAGGLAHDFNNLLGGIFGNIEMALDQDLSIDAREHLKKAIGIYYRAESLTKQLLTFSKGGAPEKKFGNIGKTLRESVLFALTGTSIVPEFSIDKNLDSVEYDQNQIAEVINNIAINAKQAMNGQGNFRVGAGNIEINDDTGIRNGKYVQVSLEDSGPGISKDIIGKIFDPFFSTKKQGSGLGLAMSYSIIKKHGGFLTVESSEGSGAVFRIFLPVSDKFEDTPLSDIKIIVKGEGRILIMDDEDYIRNVVGDMIKAMGYTPITASDGKEAIKAVEKSIAENEKISLILLDLTVPGGMGGAEAVKEIRKISEDIPVIASSGYSDDPVIASPKEHGFNDSLKKPFLIAGLSEVINRNLKR